jgi:antitoxin ParD1/3/4
MTTMNVSLPDEMKAFVEEQVQRGGYSTASEYLRELIRDAQKQAAKERLE